MSGTLRRPLLSDGDYPTRGPLRPFAGAQVFVFTKLGSKAFVDNQVPYTPVRGKGAPEGWPEFWAEVP